MAVLETLVFLLIDPSIRPSTGQIRRLSNANQDECSDFSGMFPTPFMFCANPDVAASTSWDGRFVFEIRARPEKGFVTELMISNLQSPWNNELGKGFDMYLTEKTEHLRIRFSILTPPTATVYVE